ncbi:MAG: biopolymer transporter ExbD [Planctomycetes bacterium]|nr:biopolymer transporter ExbD [Planctomycetota bacterium]
MLIQLGKRVMTTRLNLTPMIDCTFLLLTFFMVVSELTRQYDALEVQLPRVKASTTIPPETHIIKLTSDGTLYWAGERLAVEDLRRKLRWLRETEPDASVVVKADERTPFKHIREVFKACADRRVRIWRLAFGALPTEEQGKAQEKTP